MNVYVLIDRGECWECVGSTEIRGIYVDLTTAQLALETVQSEPIKLYSKLEILELPLLDAVPATAVFPVGYSFQWEANVSCCGGFNSERSELAQIFQDLEHLADDGLDAIDSDELYVSYSEERKVFRMESTVVAHRLRVSEGGRFINACVLRTRVEA